MKLILTNDHGTEVLRMDIEDVQPAAVVTAITSLPKAKKRRSDAGKPRLTSKPESADGQE